MSQADLSHVLAPAVKRSLADEVIERLRAAITCGKLPPGQALRETVLAESLGVSRGPVREALRRLEHEGLVVTRPNGRTYVARLSRRDLEEVFSLRAALESLIVEYACTHATSQDFAELQDVIDTMASYVQRGISVQEASDLDVRFHVRLSQASGHRRARVFWQTLQPQIYVFLLSRNVAGADYHLRIVDGHQRILDMIKAGDKTRAVEEIGLHLSYAYHLIVDSYDQCCDDDESSREPEQTGSLKPDRPLTTT